MDGKQFGREFGACLLVSASVAGLSMGLDALYHLAVRGPTPFHVVMFPLMMPFFRVILIGLTEKLLIPEGKLLLLIVAFVGCFCAIIIGVVGTLLKSPVLEFVLTTSAMAMSLTSYIKLEKSLPAKAKEENP